VRAVIQRVTKASVTVADEPVGACEQGVLILLGVARGDTEATATRLAEKIARLRIFENAEGRLDYSTTDVGGSALVISQFTLLADTSKGTRPSFTNAAPPDEAAPLIDAFCARLASCGIPLETGRFGARMLVSLVNDGPVTIVLDA
jgi:D-aminoacyl-tRNA deacylase